MSDHHVNIPAPQFSTYATVIDPPKQVTATHPDEMNTQKQRSVWTSEKEVVLLKMSSYEYNYGIQLDRKDID
uniref:Clr5 domain-containing protein n=1 Tax=Caenorhabditis tropicalis TaxID=1561998 RepID=A0A1I7SXW6_9PELO